MGSLEEAKALIPELCKQFYDSGWVSGTGGGMSIRVGDSIVVAPSGVQKERMKSEDLYVLDINGRELETPVARPWPYKSPKLSECYPLFQKVGKHPSALVVAAFLTSYPHELPFRTTSLWPQAYQHRNAGAVLHSHSLSAVTASVLDQTATEFRVTELEMIKVFPSHVVARIRLLSLLDV